MWYFFLSKEDTLWLTEIIGPFISNSISHINKIIICIKEGWIKYESHAINISIMVEKTKHTEDDSQWYPPLYFLMSRKENNSISPINIFWVAIQYAVKLIVGIIINNKYWIA